MSDHDVTTSLPLEHRIDLACDRLESGWQSMSPPDLQDLLDGFSTEERESALRELLAVELELRLKRGDTFRKQDYLSRLPEYSGLVSELFDSELERRLQTTLPKSSPETSVGGPETSTAGDDETHSEPSPAAEMNRPAATPRPIPRSLRDRQAKPAIPERIGKYRIVDALDRGGQATVYRALHPELGRDVVIKFCHHDRVVDPNAQESLRSEGRLLAELKHENLAQVYDFDFHDGRAYIVMEFVRGLNLNQYQRQRSPSPEQWIPMLRQVAEALDYVHQRGVLHLDLKPQNILIDEAGVPRLIDFGLARADSNSQQSGPDSKSISGTLAYMAPEQARCDAEQIGPQSDLFGLGGVLFFLLTGSPPRTGKTFDEVLEDAREGNWNRPLLADHESTPLGQLAVRSLAADPEDRVGSAADFAEALRQIESTANPMRKLVFGIAAALIVALIVTASGWWSRDGASADDITTSGEMKMRVYRDGTTLGLVDSVPVATGDRVEIRTQIPAGIYASLFLFDSAGTLQLIDSVPAQDSEYEFRFPKDDKEYEQIVGPAGTEFAFLCGRPDRPFTEDELTELGLFSSVWPMLPEDAVIQIRSDAVEPLQTGRGFGGGVRTIDPQQLVTDQLEALRKQLTESGGFVEGIAFAHID